MEEGFKKLMQDTPSDIKPVLENIPELVTVMKRMYNIGWLDCGKSIAQMLQDSLPEKI